MLHVCVQKFDVTGSVEIFLELNRPDLLGGCCCYGNSVSHCQELVWERSRTKVVQPPAGMERQMGDLILCNRMCFLSFCSGTVKMFRPFVQFQLYMVVNESYK